MQDRAADLTQNFISQVERGKIQRPMPEKIQSLAAGLSVDYAWLMVQAGYPHPGGGEITATGEVGEIERDVLAFAQDRPDLLRALHQLREENTRQAYEEGLMIIHRSLISGIETARDLLQRRQREPKDS